MPASAGERRAAGAVMLVSALVFVLLAPMAKLPLIKITAFIPIYQSALVVCDLVTVALLLGQYMITCSRALRALVCGYLFTALMASLHLLSFPGLLAESGAIGGNTQTTAWLYMFWHAGFPLSVVAYAYSGGSVGTQSTLAMLRSLALVAAGALGLALLATAGIGLLPAVMSGNRYTPAMIFVVSSVWLLSLWALLALWRQPQSRVLDLWLMAVMCAWLCDVALSAVFNAGRYDLGFYAGRIFGLLAASVVMLVLLLENAWLYARLLQTSEELRRLMSIDALTGLANRRSFDEALAQEWRRAQRRRAPLALLMIDVDHFKLFNDCYGHVAGDVCLRRVAQAIADSAQRAGEVPARYGGEEFAVLLPELDQEQALRTGLRICQAVTALAIAHARSTTEPQVTVSIGVASLRPESVRDAVDLVEQADAALYQAKAGGRNRAMVAQGKGDGALAGRTPPAIGRLTQA